MGVDGRDGWPEVPGYQVTGVVGRGGFSTVYRAIQLSVGREVALKVLRSDGLDVATEARFRSEVRTVGTLSWHPHVVGVIDAGTTPTGVPFISMDLVPGGSWAERVRRDGRLDDAAVARIGAQVADALLAAHAAGILHRDIKPDNVLVGHRDDALLSDFGIATIASGTHTTGGAVVGTLAYMAPETLQGQRATPASDTFALGVTLYTLCSGRAAFVEDSDESPAAIMWRVVNGDHPALPSEVHSGLAEAIGSAMHTDAADRADLERLAARLRSVGATLASAPGRPFPHTDADATQAGPAPVAPPAITRPPVEAPRHDLTPGDPTADEAAVPTGVPRSGDGGAGAGSTGATRTRRSRWPAVVVGLVTLAAVGVVAGTRIGRSADPEPTTIAVGDEPKAIVVLPDGVWTADFGADTVTRIDPSTDLATAVRVGRRPTDLVVADGALWVSDHDDGTVSRVDLASEQVTTIEVGRGPSGIAASADGVWVANTEDDTTTRIDLATRRADEPVAVGDQPEEVVATADGVWVANVGDGTVTALGDGPPVTVPVGPRPREMVAVDGAVWVAVEGGGTVARVAVDDLTVEQVTVGAGPYGVAADDEAVWVTSSDDDSVTRIDQLTRETTRVAVGKRPRLVTLAGGGVWVSNRGEDTVTRIDPDGEGSRQVVVGNGPFALAGEDDLLWVTNYDDDTVSRLPAG